MNRFDAVVADVMTEWAQDYFPGVAAQFFAMEWEWESDRIFAEL